MAFFGADNFLTGSNYLAFVVACDGPRRRLAWPIRRGADSGRRSGKRLRPVPAAQRYRLHRFPSRQPSLVHVQSGGFRDRCGRVSRYPGTVARLAASRRGARVAMHPILFEFGSFTIYTYGVLVATGVLLGLWYARHQATRAGLSPDKIWNLGIYMILSALVLAKIWLVASDWQYFAAHPREIFGIATYQSGGTFYGGVLGAFLMIALYTYFQKMPILSVLDIFGGALPLGHAIGRLGCFAAGCCYGRPTSAPWGVIFHNQAAGMLAGTPLGIRLHPTQLYEAADEYLNFALLV